MYESEISWQTERERETMSAPEWRPLTKNDRRVGQTSQPSIQNEASVCDDVLLLSASRQISRAVRFINMNIFYPQSTYRCYSRKTILIHNTHEYIYMWCGWVKICGEDKANDAWAHSHAAKRQIHSTLQKHVDFILYTRKRVRIFSMLKGIKTEMKNNATKSIVIRYVPIARKWQMHACTLCLPVHCTE